MSRLPEQLTRRPRPAVCVRSADRRDHREHPRVLRAAYGPVRAARAGAGVPPLPRRPARPRPPRGQRPAARRGARRTASWATSPSTPTPACWASTSRRVGQRSRSRRAPRGAWTRRRPALIAECERRARANRSPVFAFHTAGFMGTAIELYDGLGYQRAPEYDVDLGLHYGFHGLDPIPVIAYRRDLVTAAAPFPGPSAPATADSQPVSRREVPRKVRGAACDLTNNHHQEFAMYHPMLTFAVAQTRIDDLTRDLRRTASRRRLSRRGVLRARHRQAPREPRPRLARYAASRRARPAATQPLRRLAGVGSAADRCSSSIARAQRAASLGCPAARKPAAAADSSRSDSAGSPSARAMCARASCAAAAQAVPGQRCADPSATSGVVPGGVEVTDLGTRDRRRDGQHDHAEAARVGLPQRRLGLVDQRAGGLGRRAPRGSSSRRCAAAGAWRSPTSAPAAGRARAGAAPPPCRPAPAGPRPVAAGCAPPPPARRRRGAGRPPRPARARRGRGRPSAAPPRRSARARTRRRAARPARSECRSRSSASSMTSS